MGTSKNLLRAQTAALVGARNPHVLRVHSGFSAPSASYSCRSRQFIEVPLSLKVEKKVNMHTISFPRAPLFRKHSKSGKDGVTCYVLRVKR